MVDKEEPSHLARLRNPSGCHYIWGTRVSVVLKKKNKEETERIRQPLHKPPGNHGPSNKPGTHTVWKSKGKKQDRRVSMSVPSCKGTLLQGSGRPWYRGYGTTQEQRAWLFGQLSSVVQTTMTASSCNHGHLHLYSNQLSFTSNYEANFNWKDGCWAPPPSNK